MSDKTTVEKFNDILMIMNGDPVGCYQFRHMLECFEKQAFEGNVTALRACYHVDQFHRMLEFASNYDPRKAEKT